MLEAGRVEKALIFLAPRVQDLRVSGSNPRYRPESPMALNHRRQLTARTLNLKPYVLEGTKGSVDLCLPGLPLAISTASAARSVSPPVVRKR